MEAAAIADDELDHEEIRQALRTEMAASGRAGADTAKLVGIGGSTLLAWINGKYGGNNDVVSRKVKTWLDSRTTMARVQSSQVQVCFTATPTALAFIAALEVAQFTPDVVVLAGGAGVGKTTTCRHYARTHRNVWHLTAEPAVSSGFAVLERLCAMLGVRESSPAARSYALAQKMLGSSGLIIMDEAQHLKADAVEQVRSLHDVAGVGLALVGNEQVYARIDGGGRRAEFAQLFSRVGMRVRRPKPYREDIEALLDANDVTGDVERRLLRVIAGKPGALRGMVKTLRVARMLAQADEQPFGAAHVRAAWSRVSDAAPIDGEAA